MENIIKQPLYLWAFQTNREQLKLLFFPFRSEKHTNIPIKILVEDKIHFNKQIKSKKLKL